MFKNNLINFLVIIFLIGLAFFAVYINQGKDEIKTKFFNAKQFEKIYIEKIFV